MKSPWYVLLLLTGLFLANGAAAQKLDTTPRLAVMSAFAPELAALLSQTDVADSFVVNGRTFTTGSLAGNEVVLFLSGVSMVNAAMTTQLAIDRFNLQGIVFSGIAGGVNPNLSIGDVTVPARWAEYQEQFFARDTPEGWDTGFYAEAYGNYGMMFPKDVEVTSVAGAPDAVEPKFWFEVDPAMLEVAEGLSRSGSGGGSGGGLERCTDAATCLEAAPELVVGGNGVSGSTFVNNADYRAWVWDTFEAQALDMETAAVAHVAYANGLPYIAFRSLSDLAGGGPGENEMGTFFGLAATNSAAVVTRFLEAWAQETPSSP